MDNARPDRRRWRITRLFNQIDPAGLEAALIIACPPHREKCMLEVTPTANDVGCTLLIQPFLKKRCCNTTTIAVPSTVCTRMVFWRVVWVFGCCCRCCLSAQRPSVMTKVYFVSGHRGKDMKRGQLIRVSRRCHPTFDISIYQPCRPSVMRRCSLASSFDVFFSHEKVTLCFRLAGPVNRS